MTYVIETRTEQEKDWYVVIDVELSKVLPVHKEFPTEEVATQWAESNLSSVSRENWRVTKVSEDDSQ